VACVAAGLGTAWQPQLQVPPEQVLQAQVVGCVMSFIVDLLGGSTTGCHRWLHFGRDASLPPGDCDELSARVPDRSCASPEWCMECLARVARVLPSRTLSCRQFTAHGNRSLAIQDACRTR
jgi:hypothetical protein